MEAEHKQSIRIKSSAHSMAGWYFLCKKKQEKREAVSTGALLKPC